MLIFNSYNLLSLFLVAFGAIFAFCHICYGMFIFTTIVVFHLLILQDLVWSILYCIHYFHKVVSCSFFVIFFIIHLCNDFRFNNICCAMFISTTIAMFCFHLL